MTKEEIETLGALFWDEAWFVRESRFVDGQDELLADDGDGERSLLIANQDGDAVVNVRRDARFIAAIHNAWPTIRAELAELERLRAYVADYETNPLPYPPSYPRGPSVSLDDLFDDEKPEES